MVFVGTDPDVIEAERAEWALWRQALVELVDPLNAQMSEHQATGPAAEAEPWTKPAPVVHGIVPVEPVRQVKDAPAAELRARAQAPVQTRAMDWSTPAVSGEESADGGRTHGRS
jgi:hypothetical protein